MPHTILSDGEHYNIKIKKVNVKAEYQYFIVNELDKDAFLTASIIDWNELNQLSGKTSIFYEGTFTSESFWKVDRAYDNVSISLGIAKSILLRELQIKAYIKRKGLEKI